MGYWRSCSINSIYSDISFLARGRGAIGGNNVSLYVYLLSSLVGCTFSFCLASSYFCFMLRRTTLTGVGTSGVNREYCEVNVDQTRPLSYLNPTQLIMGSGT